MAPPTTLFTLFLLLALELICNTRLVAQVVADVEGGGSKNFDVHDAMSFEPQHSKYQYIIVGRGTTGCALAATLSQHYQVVLLERGGSPYGNPSIERLEGWGDLLVDHYEPGNEPLNSPVQAFQSADGVPNRRAHVLGGGSAINAGLYSRASRETVASMGWEPALVNESYEWVEEKIVYQPKVTWWHLAFKRGLLEAGVTPDNGRTFEHLVGTKILGTIFDESGRRHTTADLLSYGNAKLLTVVTYANVHRVVFENSDPTAPPQAVGVEYSDPNGKPDVIRLRSGACNEVVLSAGALGRPQLLLVSGVGPCGELAGLGIPQFNKGHLRLETTNISENPYVQFNYYNNTHDIQTCRKGIEYLLKLLNSSAMSSYKFDAVTPLVLTLYPNLGIPVGENFIGVQIPTDVENVTATTQWCKDTVVTIWHYHGGCVLQKVVDSSYQVHGVRSLRVVDGSTFTTSPGSNPQATVMMLGRPFSSQSNNETCM